MWLKVFKVQVKYVSVAHVCPGERRACGGREERRAGRVHPLHNVNPLGKDALEGGELTPPPLHSAQPMPSYCLPDAKCQLQWHLSPKVTAPNRFGNLLQPPV